MSEARLLDHSAPLFDTGGPLSAASVAAMRADPRFRSAMRVFMTNMMALYRGNRLLNMLINDRGRMLMGYLALYLNENGRHDGRGRGFGAGQLKAIVASAGFASPGRTTAMLALMRMAGYIASATAPEDKRRHILVPTEKLRESYRDRWERIAATVREVRPEAASAFALDDPEYVAAYVRITADYFLGGFRLVDIAPEMELFLDRNGGMMLLFTVLLGGEAGDAMPPRRPVPVSISAIASRFGVSRAHVRTVLREAEVQGLMERTDGNHVVIRPVLNDAIETFFANALLFVAHCAEEARDEVRHSPQGRASSGAP